VAAKHAKHPSAPGTRAHRIGSSLLLYKVQEALAMAAARARLALA
jgi:hypothetical protein